MSKTKIFTALGEINIPSEFCQMNYIDANGIHLDLKECDIDMMWAIIFLTKAKLLQSNTTEGVVHITNGEIAQLNNKYTNGKYSSFKGSLSRLEQLYLQTNINGKVKADRCSKTPSKFITTFTAYKYGYDIEINPSIIQTFFNVKHCFKKVYLNILFNLKGKSAKLLYLFLKDYEGISVCIDKSKLMGILNTEDGSNLNIKNHIQKLSTQSDIDADLQTKRITYKDTVSSAYQFTVTPQNYYAFNDKNSDHWFDYHHSRMIKDEAEKQYKITNTTTPIRNKNAYISKVIHNIENDPIQSKEVECKAMLNISMERRKIQYADQKGIIALSVHSYTNGKSFYYAVGDDYCLYDEFGDQITQNAAETYDLCKALRENNGIGFELIEQNAKNKKCLNVCIGLR